MKRFALLLPLLLTMTVAVTHAVSPADLPGQAPHSANPIVPGYYADPSLVQHGGHYYIYATLDPWGGDTLGCWESSDFKNWTYRVLNWPTKKACTSPTSGAAAVWAPSVVQGRDEKFYMYVSVGNEVWAGTADTPLGPWRNLLGNQPLIPKDYKPGYHMIDAEAFVDDDGSAYLYWGSGLNWKNGRCWAVKLNPDMKSFDGEVHDVTPARYFEAPFMVKRHGRYFLMNSTGKTTATSYAVEYASSDNPFGPFIDGLNTPILSTDKANNVLSPGHHAVFSHDGHDYILYHRHSIPFDPKFIGRQLCVDELHFTDNGQIEKVTPTHTGPLFIRDRNAGLVNLAAIATASSQKDANTGPERVTDDNYATRWAAAKDAHGGWLQLDLGREQTISTQELRFEYAWKPYAFILETSTDGNHWKPLADYTKATATGSPIVINQPARARYLRLSFPETQKGSDLSLFEWLVHP